ncbi:MAG: tetratricopeptide repeat protein [Acidobacteriaceae bacterium]
MKFLPLLLFFAARIAAPQATSVRVADAPCARCHAQIYQDYLRTPMANASGDAADNLTPGTYLHQASGVSYTIENVNGVPTVSWHDTHSLEADQHATLSYFLGSGHLGTTWLYSVDHYLFESPVAWYASFHGLDMKPGLEKADTRLPALPVQSACLRCHMSAVQKSDAGSINRYSGLPFLHTGITCEACHGDTRQHVLSGGKTPALNPTSLQPERRDSVCISCHLEGDVSVERMGRNALDYRPGESISDFLAYYVYAKSDPNARGVSEVEQFSQSMCKRMSGDRMSCTSCHDPHFTPAASERVAFFRRKCLACHGGSFAASHHPENPDCTSCHMPHLGAENIPHVAWTDHRILRLPQASPTPLSAAGNELTPIFSPGVTSRDLGMAYYQALLQGNRAVEPLAWSLLHGQREAISGDPAALDALAELDAERGNYKDAEAEFRRVLVLEPADVGALSNLGTLLARQGNLSEATNFLRQAWERNRDLGGLAMNLARVQCFAGNTSGEAETLKSTLRYNPGVARIQQQLNAAPACVPSAAGVSRP